MIGDHQLMTHHEVADLLNVPNEYVERLVRDGHLPVHGAGTEARVHHRGRVCVQTDWGTGTPLPGAAAAGKQNLGSAEHSCSGLQRQDAVPNEPNPPLAQWDSVSVILPMPGQILGQDGAQGPDLGKIPLPSLAEAPEGNQPFV